MARVTLYVHLSNASPYTVQTGTRECDATRTIYVHPPILVAFMTHSVIAVYFKAVQSCWTPICVAFECHCRSFHDCSKICDREAFQASGVGQEMRVVESHFSVKDNGPSQLVLKTHRERKSKSGEQNMDGLFGLEKNGSYSYIFIFVATSKSLPAE